MKDLDFSSHGVEVLKDEEDVKGLIKILKHVRSRKVRAEAAYALAEIGEPAVPSLIKALGDKKSEVREETAFALAEVRDKRIIEPLIRALKDEDENVRVYAAEALGENRDKRAVEPLIQALKDEDPDVRAKAADALGLLGDKRAVEPLIQALKDQAKHVRWDAAGALRYLNDERAVEPLTQALKDESSLVRGYALTFLANMGVVGIGELLTKHLLDKDYLVREDAAEALERMSWKPQNKTEEAYYLIGKRKWKELEKIGEPAVEPLIQILKIENTSVDEHITETLEKIGWKPQNATEHAYYLVAKHRWENLWKLGETAVEPLIQALSDEGRYTREEAARTLGRIGDKRAIEPLTRALEDEYAEVRREAAEALKRMDWKPKDSNQQKYYLIGKQEWTRLADEFGESAIKPLMRFLKDKSSSVQQGVAAALKKIGKPALEPLIQALKDKDYETRAGAAHALGQMGFSEVVEPLIRALKDKNEDVRSSAAEALGNTGDKRAVKPLIYALEDGYNCVRQEAAYALGDIKDGRALKPLTRILKEEKREYEEEEEDEYEECTKSDVLEAVIYALGEIGGESVKKAFTEVIEDYSDEDVLESTEGTLMELRDEEMPKVLKRAFETCTDLELSNSEEFYDEWVLTYDVKKKNSKYYLPINVKIDLEQEVFSLCCELWCGLHDVGGDETVKGIADWLRGYANQIRKDAKNLQKLGFQIVDKNIDGIHYLNFNYQKDYPPKKISELIKDLKKIVEKVY